jgi:thioredoxin reductase
MSKNPQLKQVTVIGAGPVGIEAALYAKSCRFAVQLLEKKEVAHNIRQWGHVTFFSPFGMNYSLLGKKLLTERGISLPPDDAYLPAKDYLGGYLLPLAASPFLKSHIVIDCEVLAISRQFTLKGDFIGNSRRKNYPFRILTRNGQGMEKVYYSDYIIDTSGTYGNHNWMGNGGIPARGEMANEQRIQYGLEDIAGAAKPKYAGKTTLVVGDGHSAGNTMVALKQVIEENRQTRVIWLTRSSRKLPLLSISNDPLAERERIVRAANGLVFHPNVRWIRNAAIEALEYDEKTGQFRVEIETPAGLEKLTVENIVANVGFTPDNSIYRELQVHECYASRGPMKLAAALLSTSSADCLTQGSQDAEVLKNPEPDFYILGMKSYGKNSNFLLKTGFEQIRDAFRLISGNPALDLYAQPAADPVKSAQEAVSVAE